MLITQAEFARLAGVSRSAVKQAINNALITAVVEQGGKILINKNEGLQQYQAKRVALFLHLKTDEWQVLPI